MNDFAGLKGPSSIDWQGQGYGLANYGNEGTMNVLFYVRSVKDEKKSREEGRPIHVNMDYVRMQQPGEGSTVIDRPARAEDTHRFNRHWTAFLQKKTQVPEGTPIDLMFLNNPAMADNLKSNGIFTVEQCANLSAHAITNIGIGGQEFTNKAKAYLESASRGVNFLKLEAELKEEKSRNRVMATQITQLQAQLNGVLSKLENPAMSSNSPPFVPGYDAQAERLNSNHPSAELFKKRRNRPVETPSEEIPTEEPNAAY